MYPDGWHPCSRRYMRDNFPHLAKHFSRTERPPKYYFIDFGISRRYGPEDKAPLELSIRGGDKTVPEFVDDINLSRNPFQTDIYYLGNLIREAVIDVSDEASSLLPISHHCTSQEYKGFDFMQPLISDMVQDDPAKRPTIDQVVKRFADVRKKLGTLKLRARVGPRDESFGVVRDFVHLFTTIKYTLKGILLYPLGDRCSLTVFNVLTATVLYVVHVSLIPCIPLAIPRSLLLDEHIYNFNECQTKLQQDFYSIVGIHFR
jgi:hypothetical protein